MIDELDKNVGEKILNIFLELLNCRITSIIKLKGCTEENLTYMQALWTELTFKNSILTRNLGSSTSIRTLTSLISQSLRKVPCRRDKRGLEKKKKKIKVVKMN